MPWLILDTAADWLTVALHDREADTILSDRSRHVGLGHAEALFPAIESCLSDVGIMPEAVEGVVVTLGPGSFTGVRIAISAANGFAQATGCALRGVSVHAALAMQAGDGASHPFAVVTDARRDAVFAARCEEPGGRLGALAEWTVAEARDRLCDCVELIGNGAPLVAQSHHAVLLGDARTALPAAIARAAFLDGETDADLPLAPLYLRGADARVQTGFALPRAHQTAP